MGVTKQDLEHNYTDEVAAYYDNRLRKLRYYAGQWPIRVAFSRIGPGHPTHDVGTRQCHLLCWLEKDEGLHCGQGVYILALGQALYTTRPDGIIQAIQTHIAQCHSEVYDGDRDSHSETAGNKKA